MGGGGGQKLSPDFRPPIPTALQAPKPLGFTFHFCSSSMAINGHCSVEKDKNVFSLAVLFLTFSVWVEAWPGRPPLGGVAPVQEGQPG